MDEAAPAPRRPAAKTAPATEEPPPHPAGTANGAAMPAADALHPDPLGGMEDSAKNADEAGGGREPGIVIQPWDPKTPYMDELKAAASKDAFAVYMKHRAEYGDSPAFYLDCADFFLRRAQPELGLQVLSNIAEMELENPALLRVLAHRLEQLHYLDLAATAFEEVLALRPEEPQSYRDLALVLARRAQDRQQQLIVAADMTGAATDRALAEIKDDYARAVDLLWETVVGYWDGRFAEIEVIALTELNRIIPRARRAGVDEIPVDKRLIKPMPVDVRIILTWDADNTDIDLWVTEPSGEKGYYAHNRTTIGGAVSRDFTGGYGPEEYMVRRGMTGMYKIECNYYGSNATRLLGGVTVQADVFTNYGRENERRQSLTIRLQEAEDTVKIGDIEF
jgi:hypothetical protein